jgi:hypothetical protein
MKKSILIIICIFGLFLFCETECESHKLNTYVLQPYIKIIDTNAKTEIKILYNNINSDFNFPNENILNKIKNESIGYDLVLIHNGYIILIRYNDKTYFLEDLEKR